MRYTALVREIVEHALNGVRLAESEEFSQINERLARIEAAVVDQPNGSDKVRSVREWARKQGTKARETQKVAGRTGRRMSEKR